MIITVSSTEGLGCGNTGCEVFKRGYNIKNIFAKESTYPKEIIEFWINGELSKIGHNILVINEDCQKE